jgi:hypothetical protein
MAAADPTPRVRARRRPRPLGRTLAALGAAALLALGLVVFLTPLPFGALLVGVALVILIRISPTARLVRRALARRYPETARRLDRLRQAVRARLFRT